MTKDLTTAEGGTEGLREALIATIREELDIGPRRWIGMLADALLAGPLARASAEQAGGEAERADERTRRLMAERAAERWMRDCRAAEAQAAELGDNLIALAKMYGEACRDLVRLHMALDWDDTAYGMYTARQNRERIATLTAERDAALKVSQMNATSGGFYARHAENATKRAEAAEAENALLKKHIGALRGALDRSEARYAEAQNGPNG